MTYDQHRLRQRLRALESKPPSAESEAQAAAIEREIAASMSRRAQRAAALPTPSYPEDLPISQRRKEIAQAIAANQVVIVCGETGSGKTTQLPKICLDLGRGAGGMIGHTQPRRIAARTVAARIASELQSPLGKYIGYKVRFTDRTNKDGYIKIMTDGILLAETQHDRYLTQYDTLIIDEAHERSLNVDFLLGYIKQLLPKRPDLKVIITSATIDPQRFSEHFEGAPIIEVSGRTYPVDVRYRPVQAEEPDEEDPSVLQAILEAVDEIAGAEASDGDVLIFLSGEREIREVAEALRKHHPPEMQILPLYARLSVEEQNRVFQPHSGRRIVLATNVAETSLTVPGIRYVIDPGFARISRYSANARVQRLPIERISRASADQRKGRCGRIGPGICVRLYSEDEFREREEFTDPEVLRANLASVILQMKALRLGDVERFPFIDAPRPTAIRDGYQTLLELGAVDDHHRITPLGKELARLPVDPRIGRMVLAARHEKCLREVLIIAAALATQDARLRPLDAQIAADAAHQPFADESSDFLSYLKLWDAIQENARHLSTNKLRQWCKRSFISYPRWREWHDVHQQLHALATEGGMKLNDAPAESSQIHRALLAGLLNNIGMRGAPGAPHEYRGPRERKFHIFPGSGLFKKPPKWIMAAELVETTRLYARTAARIHPEWIERAGRHLLKHAHSDPHWNEQTAHVEAYERITLHGLVIVPKRRVHYGSINGAQAREIFITQALVEGALPPPYSDAPFFAHNRALMNELRTMEAKTRRRNVMVEQQALFEFYDRRVPPADQCVYDGPSFEQWRQRIERDTPDFLFMTPADVRRTDAPSLDPNAFPEAINLDGIRVPLTYHFDPGGPIDGVSATVPVEAIHQITQRSVEWLVPGLLAEKITALIRTLPKSIRRNFVPAPEFGAAAAQALEFSSGDLLEQAARELHRRGGAEIPRAAWKPEQLPDYLRLHIRVTDRAGGTLAEGRDVASVRRETFRKVAPGDSREPAAAIARHSGHAAHVMTENQVAWTFGDLPRQVDVTRGAFTIPGFPAIVDREHSVAVQIFESRAAAAQAHHVGLRRLFFLQVSDELMAHIRYLPNLDDLTLLFSVIGDTRAVEENIALLAVARVFLPESVEESSAIAGEDSEIRTQTEFVRRLRSGWDRLWPAVSEAGDLAAKILTSIHALTLQLDEADLPQWENSIADMRAQLARLSRPGFLINTPFLWLAQYPRYVAAMGARLRKLVAGNLARDLKAADDIAKFWSRYESATSEFSDDQRVNGALARYRWMIEEYRVSLFAQELGTMVPVSAKRLDAQWALVEQQISR